MTKDKQLGGQGLGGWPRRASGQLGGGREARCSDDRDSVHTGSGLLGGNRDGAGWQEQHQGVFTGWRSGNEPD